MYRSWGGICWIQKLISFKKSLYLFLLTDFSITLIRFLNFLYSSSITSTRAKQRQCRSHQHDVGSFAFNCDLSCCEKKDQSFEKLIMEISFYFPRPLCYRHYICKYLKILFSGMFTEWRCALHITFLILLIAMEITLRGIKN